MLTLIINLHADRHIVNLRNLIDQHKKRMHKFIVERIKIIFTYIKNFQQKYNAWRI